MASSARIEELEKKFNENPRRYFAPLANEYRKAGEVEQAITLCRAYLPQQPGHMSGHIVFGQALFDAGHLDESQGVFETALSLDPENLIALRHLGDIARLRGDVSVARTWYQRVLDADPRNEEIAAQLGELGAGSTAAPAPASKGEDVTWKEINPESRAAPAAEAAQPAKTTPQVEPPSAPEVSTAAPVSGPPVGGPAAQSATPAPAAEPDIAIDIDALFDADKAPAPAAGSAPASHVAGSSAEAPQVVPPSPAAAESSPDAPPPQAALADGDLVVAEFVPPPEAPPRALGLETGHEVVVGGQIETTPASSPRESSPAAFVTETMAELYLQQGFVREALAVYRQLLEANPDDPGLRERVDQLEHGGRSSVSMAELSDEVVEAARRRQTSPMRRSMRAFLGSLAARRAPRPSGEQPAIDDVDGTGGGNAGGHAESGQLTVDEPSRETREAGGAAARQEHSPEPMRSDSPAALDVLFHGSPVTPDDQAAASALAGAFNSNNVRTSSTPLSGRPARTAPTELSLDHVFRESGGDAGLGRQRSDFSFDQFFADEATEGSAEPAEDPDIEPARSEQPGEDDIGQFNDWLEGLKKK